MMECSVIRSNAIRDWSQWFRDMQTEWDLFTMTAVFKSGSESEDNGRWDSHYARVIRKLNKRLSRHSCDIRFGTGDLMLNLPYRSKSIQEHCNALVLEKFKRVSEKERKSITFHDLYFHEFDEISRFSHSVDHRSAHHIHGVVGIPKGLTRKAWDCEHACINPKLAKDFASMDMISSVMMDPMRQTEIEHWVAYISKRKAFYEN